MVNLAVGDATEDDGSFRNDTAWRAECRKPGAEQRQLVPPSIDHSPAGRGLPRGILRRSRRGPGATSDGCGSGGNSARVFVGRLYRCAPRGGERPTATQRVFCPPHRAFGRSTFSLPSGCLKCKSSGNPGPTFPLSRCYKYETHLQRSGHEAGLSTSVLVLQLPF